MLRCIEEEKSQSVSWAEGLLALETIELARNQPGKPITEETRRQAKIFENELHRKLAKRKTRKAGVRMLQWAVDKLNEKPVTPNRVKRHFSVKKLLILAIIYVREVLQHRQPQLDTTLLRKLVTPYHRVKGEPGPISDSHWNDCLEDPDVIQVAGGPLKKAPKAAR